MKSLKIVVSFAFFLILSCNNAQKNNSEDKTYINEPSNSQRKIETRIFRNDTIAGSNLTGFGYDILVNGIVHIHQPHIPAASGLKGFSTEVDARIVAEYLSTKMQMTNTRPPISPQELDSLGIKY